MDHQEHCNYLEAEIEHFASLVDESRLELPVPSCPGWSVRDLVVHLGTLHRWAEHLVRVRAPQRIGPEAMGLGEPRPSAAWVRAGGKSLVATLRGADPDAAMWAWGSDRHTRFWSRRQLHETLVHRMDGELAIGLEPLTSPTVANDAIDEFLANLAGAAYFSPKVKNLRGDGARLVVHSTDDDRGWGIVLGKEGFAIEPSPGGPASAGLEGPALSLLLVLYRRSQLPARGVTVYGDSSLVEFWLANSALE